MKKIFSLFAAVLFAGSMLAADLYSYDFKANGQGEWTINNVTLPDGISYVWNYDNRFGMKASAYVSGTNYETESWLVSPVLDLSEAESATLAFSHARKYGNLDQLSVRAKAGEGDWLNLEVSAWPDGSSWDFVNATADMADFAGEAEVQVAFVYTSSTTAGATWEIGTVAISTDGGDIEPEVTPAVPEGVFTCADAVQYAANAADPTADNKNVEVGAATIRGFVTFAYDAKDEEGVVKQSAWIADLKSASAGVVQGYYLQLESMEAAVAKGDYVELEGTLVKYFKAENNIILEVTNGTMKKVFPMGIENATMSTKATKMVVDGQLYIVRDGKMFNVTGAQVR